MSAIKDSVHEWIPLDPIAEDLLDTPAFQRLRHIKQLSTVRLVYPSASHTRFEHSLGVYHLADRAIDHLGIDGDRAEHVRAAALLHDVGHGPYGHQTETVIYRRTGQDHDEIEWLLAGGDPYLDDVLTGGGIDTSRSEQDRHMGGNDRPILPEVLDSHGLDPERIAGLVRGEGDLGGLISGELDVDRMDYLVRDAHHTGVPYGTIDHGRLVRGLELHDGALALGEGNLETAESLLLARVLMNSIVYRHHVSRIAGAMLERASERLLEHPDAGMSIDRFRRLADHDLLVALRRYVPDLGRRIERRNLFKRAVWVGFESVPAGVSEFDREAELDAAGEIADRAGVPEREVIVDIPDRPRLKESSTRVVVGGMPQRLEDVSELVGAIRRAERANWRLGVYTPEPNVDRVEPAARSVLGLSP